LVLRLDAPLGREAAVAAKAWLCRRLKAKLPGAEALAVPHFVGLQCHWHVTLWVCPTILGYCACPPGHLRQMVRREWTECLRRAGAPDPGATRAYCARVGNFERWISYVFRPKQVLGRHECPPRDRRWRLCPTTSPFYGPREQGPRAKPTASPGPDGRREGLAGVASPEGVDDHDKVQHGGRHEGPARDGVQVEEQQPQP